MIRIRNFFCIFFLLFCLGCDKPKPLGGASATYTFYGKDQVKKAPDNYMDLPKIIKDGSSSYLTRWLGPKNFAKFKYVGGRIIDRELLSVSMKNDATVPDYVLHFNIYNDTIDYTACLLMSAEGIVIEDLDFPNTSKFNDVFHLISEEKALAIAKKQSKKKGKFLGTFQYNKDKQIFIWIVDIIDKNSNVTHKNKQVIINAHTGAVIEQKDGWYYSY